MPAHSIALQLRWADLDAQGHVNNVEFVRFCEEARVQMLMAAAQAPAGGGTAGAAPDGAAPAAGGHADPGGLPAVGMVTARTEIDYRAPLYYRTEPVQVDAWVERLGTRSFTVAHEVHDAGAVYAVARTVVVCLDPATGAPAPLPDALRGRLAGLTEPGRELAAR